MREQTDRIVVDPEILAGQPVVKGNHPSAVGVEGLAQDPNTGPYSRPIPG
jgi:uncharacterized protein (DUF433 family)